MASNVQAPAPAAPKAAPRPTLQPVHRVAKVKEPMSVATYIAIVAIAAGLVVAISVYLSYHLILSNLTDLKVIAGDAQAKSDLDQKLQDAPKIIQNYDDLGSTQQLIADALPTDPNFPELVSLMDSATKVSGVTLKTIAPPDTGVATSAAAAGASTAQAQPNQPSTYHFSAEVEGPYSQLVEFYKNLELSARPIKVTSIKLSGTAGDITAEMTLESYYQGKADISDKTEVVK